MMNAATFARMRSRIERRHGGRGRKYQRELMHLVRDAGAAIVIIERKVVGYRLPSGDIVCVKERFRNEGHALDVMARIQAENHDGHRVPIRAYPCPWCRGYHLTSQQRGVA